MKAILCGIIMAILLNYFALVSAGQEKLPGDIKDPAFRQQYLEAATERIKVAPGEYGPYLGRANIYAWEKKIPEALADAKKADALKPNDVYIKAILGQIYLMQDKYDAALTEFTAAIKLQPKEVRSYNNRALAFLKLGRLTDAQMDALQAIQLDPKFGPAYEAIGEIMFRAGKYAECIKYCNQSIRFDPIGAEAYYYRGCAYERLGNKTQAAADKTRAVKMGDDGKMPVRDYP